MIRLGLFSFLAIFLFGSCVLKKKVEEVSINQKFITYDRVKIKVNSQKLGKVTLRGYIGIVRDSSFCFRFLGPLGIEVLSGRFDQTFVLKDHYNDVVHSDVLQELIDKTGIIFNRMCIESALLANVDSFKCRLANLNKSVIVLNDNERWNNRILDIENIPRKSKFQFSFTMKLEIPKTISISYYDEFEWWNVEIQVINISNVQKKCNFDF